MMKNNYATSANCSPDLEGALAEYLRAVERGESIDRENFIRRYPALREELQTFFRNQDCLDRLSPPFSSLQGRVTSKTEELSEQERCFDDYELLEEVGRGGIGVILKGRDLDLGRFLAVKILRSEYHNNAAVKQRFVEEARIGSQLQHPGIVPIYDKGKLPDGRPYFTMKLVKGKTLAELLQERGDKRVAYHENVSETLVEAAGKYGAFHAPYDLPRFVAIFEQVCQTLAYAHSQGILHRDLKPANIMVGAFGEVQVMDWGLAKTVKEKGERMKDQPDNLHPSSLVVHPSDTRAGDIIGTLAYIAPEQAQGKVHAVDTRSDVFGLGAILCEILTGYPPYTGKGLFRKAKNGDLDEAHARLDVCSADAELVRLAYKCLAANPDDRPADAAEVAEQVTAYLESVQQRLRDAEVSAAEAKVKAEEQQKVAVHERNARWLSVGLAVSVLVLALVGGGSWLLLERERINRAEERMAAIATTTRGVDKMLDKAALLRDKAKAVPVGDYSTWKEALAEWREALLAAKEAERILAVGPSDETTANRVRDMLGKLEAELRQAETDRTMVDEIAAVRMQEIQVKGNQFDVTQLDAAYEKAFQKYGIDVLALSPNEAAKRIRKCAIQQELAIGMFDWLTFHTRDNARRIRLLRLLALVDPKFQQAKKLLQAARQGDAKPFAEFCQSEELPSLPVSKLAVLGATLARAGNPKIAATFLEKVHLRHPDDFWVSVVLARTYREMNPPLRHAEIRSYTAALAARPKQPGVYYNLGIAYLKKESFDDAIAAFGQAIRLKPDYVEAYGNRGNALQANGDFDKAIADCKKALELQRDESTAYSILGLTYYKKNDFNSALKALKAGIALEPKSDRMHHDLGLVLQAQGDLPGAFAAFEKSIEFNRKHARAHYHLANLLKEKGDQKRALAEYSLAVKYEPDFAEAHTNLGLTLARTGRSNEAVLHYQKALKIKPKLINALHGLGSALLDQRRYDAAVKLFQKEIEFAPDHLPAHFNLGLAYLKKKSLEKAVEAFRAAIEIAPHSPESHCHLALAYSRKGLMQKAIPSYRRAVKLKVNYYLAWYNLGLSLTKEGDLDEAIPALQKAVLLDKKKYHAYGELGLAYQGKYMLEKAVDCYRKSLKIKPNPWAYCNLAGALRMQGKLAESLECFKKGHALGRTTPGFRSPSKRWVDEATLFLKRDARLPAILAKRAKPANLREHINYARLCYYKKYYLYSAQLYKDAFSAKPALAYDVRNGNRYQAACAAVLAGMGEDKDAKKLDEKERAAWREQARKWLSADLRYWNGQLNDQKKNARRAARKALQRWRWNPALAPVREADLLATVPESERKKWRKLWIAADGLVKKTRNDSN